jgi:holin-like protein
VRGFVLLLLFFGLGTAGAKWLPIPIPGNMLGMLLLAAALLTGLVKIETVERASSFMLRHMLLFFVPILVGVIEYVPLLARHQGPLLLALLVGPPLVILSSGWIVQKAVESRTRQTHLKSVGKEESA